MILGFFYLWKWYGDYFDDNYVKMCVCMLLDCFLEEMENKSLFFYFKENYIFLEYIQIRDQKQ